MAWRGCRDKGHPDTSTQRARRAASNKGLLASVADHKLTCVHWVSFDERKWVRSRKRRPSGKPNGLALALMARMKLSGLPILMVGKKHLAEFAEGVAQFLPHPVDYDDLVMMARRLLSGKAGDPPAPQAPRS